MPGLTIAYEDDRLLVVDKPSGLHSALLPQGGSDSSVSALLSALRPECATASGKPEDGGLVNRLDLETSGLLIAAKSRVEWERLRAELVAGKIWKSYLAIVCGELTGASEISGWIGTPNRRAAKVKFYRSKPSKSARALPSHTHLEGLAYEPGADLSLVRALARSARRHQIRVHAAQLGHPLAGDELYGATKELPAALARRFFLHCDELRLPDPAGEREILVRSALPEAVRALFPGLE